MSEISMHIRHYMFHQFQLGNNARAAARNVCAALGEGVVTHRICRDCFKSFRGGDASLENRPRSTHPLQPDIERIKTLIEDNLSLVTLELSAMFRCN